MLTQIKHRAKIEGIKFSITIDDLVMPEVCPLLGIKLKLSGNRATGRRDDSPSVDRIDPRRGYEPGNVWIISDRANRLKSDASLDELQLVTGNLAKHLFRKQSAEWFKRAA